MSFILNYNSILLVNRKIDSQFGGSSKFQIVDGELITKKQDNRNLRRLENSQDLESTKENSTEQNSEPEKKAQKKSKSYVLNKSRVKKKILALSRLEKSKNFLAFYSISFPKGLSDKAAYQVFNTWLTRCRRDANLKSYLWVAERQKNGTVHFHLLTNNYMPIKVVNSFMGSSLRTLQKNGNRVLKKFECIKYNGVDVKRVNKNNRGIASYLTKYITKNDIEFHKLPWHCSRNISELFTSTNFEKPEGKRYFNLLPKDKNKYTSPFGDKQFYKGVGFKFEPNNKLFEDIDSVNEAIFSLDS